MLADAPCNAHIVNTIIPGSDSLLPNTNDMDNDILDITLDDDSIVNLSRDFPRLNNLQNNTCDYYTSKTYNNIFENSNCKVSDNLNIIHINIRGLEAHFNDFISYLSTFSKNTFDIICLSEAHLFKSNSYLDLDRFDIEGYTSYKIFSTIKYGGCVIYVRSTLQSCKISDLSGTNDISDFLFINVNIPGSKKQLSVAVYYRHNKHGKKTRCKFIEQIDTQLSSPLVKNKHLIILGDMNIDLAKLSIDNEVEMYHNTLTTHNLESHINSPTRIQYNATYKTLFSATIIDHIFSNLTEFKCTSGNLSYADSDHYANFLTIFGIKNKPAHNYVKTPIYKRNYTTIDVDQLHTDFECVDWNDSVLKDSIPLNNAVLNLIDKLNILCDKHAPLIKVPRRKINYIYKPWITKDILPYIIAKNNMAKKRHLYPDKFKKLRNSVNQMISKSKNNYYKKYFAEHSKNSKKVWEGIRSAIEWNKSKSNVISSVKNIDGNLLTDRNSIAQAFANYFEHIPHKCVNKLHKTQLKKNYSKKQQLCKYGLVRYRCR